MDAITSPQKSSNYLRQWRRKTKDENDDDNAENGLGMTLPLGLNKNKGKSTLRTQNIALTEEEIKALEEDHTLDKGYTVWRTLPMESDLEKKLKSGQSMHRSADFTKVACPEAYLPGYQVRAGGPINRPRNVQAPATRKPKSHIIAQQKVQPPPRASVNKTHISRDVTATDPKRESSDISSSSHDNVPVPRQPASGVLQNAVLRQTSES